MFSFFFSYKKDVVKQIQFAILHGVIYQIISWFPMVAKQLVQATLILF